MPGGEADGHEYLRKRHINPEAFDGQQCKLVSCSDSAAVGMVMNYGRLTKAINAVEEMGVEMIGAMEAMRLQNKLVKKK